MIIIYKPPVLQVTDAELAAAIGTLSTTVEATVTLNCGTQLVQAYTGADLTNPASKFYIPLPTIALNFNPSMFGLTEYVDGVYYISVKVTLQAGGYVQASNCIFVDITYKCKVAQLLKGLASGDTTALMAHLLHYSLVNGSNCGCNCDELCENFAALTEILTDSTLQITNDCGCN